MKKLTIFLAFLLFVGFQAAAQMQITGTVTGAEDGVSIPGVSVVVKGNATIGTTTDIDGKYSFTVPSSAETLVFSFVGMINQEVAINGRSVIDVIMESEVLEMDEVIVVGYGVRSKKNLVSSVSKVDASEMRKVSVASIDAALQGQAAGLVVNQNSGAPGQGMSLRVRGVTTISGSNQPLYVVDGVPVITGNMASDVYGGQGGNAVTNISPSDVESVEILKDASAAAIYGARGSNGVIIITTKRGKAGSAPIIEFNTTYGTQNAIKKYEVMSTGEYYKFADYAMFNGLGYDSYWSWANGWVSSPFLTEEDEELANFYNEIDSDGNPVKYDDYIDMVYRDNVPVWETSLSVRGGNDMTQYYLGGSMFGQEGVIAGQSYARKSVRANLDQKVNNWLGAYTNISISEENINRINGDNNIFAPLTTAILEQPGWDVKNELGEYTNPTNGGDWRFSNPVQNANEIDGNTLSTRTLGNIGFRINLIEGLKFNTDWGLDRVDFKERRYYPADTYQGAPSVGDAFLNSDTYNKWLTSNTLNYITDFGKSTINALVGYEYEKSVYTYNFSQRQNFGSTELRWVTSGANAVDASANQTERMRSSVIGRVAYNFDERFLVDISLRADGSSKFDEDNRVGYFPGISAGWKLHNETWFPLKDLINEFKIKGGYGLTGNDSGIGTYSALWRVTPTQYAAYPGLSLTQIADPDLTWEKTSQINFGFDLGLFKDRINLEYQYYNKKTTDLLLNKPIAPSSGFTSITSNVGEMQNTGHEISLRANILSKDFGWSSTFNFATLKNEITKLYQDTPIDYGFATRVAVGESLGAFFVFETEDKLDENGNVVYIDNNGDGVISDDDKAFVGKPLPDFTGNFLNTFTYKGIDLSINLQYSWGYEIYNNSMAFGGASGSFAFNKFKSETDYWTPDNTDTDLPKPNYGAQQSANNRDSDRFIEDGSYIRLKNITLGYTLPENLVKFAKVKVFVGVDNIYTWTSYSGLDPEVNAFGASNVATGTDFFTQGLNRTIKGGLNITF